MSKSVKYIVLIAALLLANLWLFFSDSSVSMQSDSKYFEEIDLNNVSTIQFEISDSPVRLEKTAKGWTLNEIHQADEGFINTLIAILQKVEKGKTIENWDQAALGKVTVAFDDNTYRSFEVASNAMRTKSYFIVDGVAQEVAVPGYRNNVVDLFLMHPDQWRDRLVFDGNWRTIQKVKVDFTDGTQSFEVKFDDKFFLVNGNTPLDSTAVIEYLNQFEYLQANEMISKGRFSNFDSLSATQPLVEITLDDIKSEEPVTLSVYPALNSQPFHLVVLNNESQMVIDARRVGTMLSKPN